MHPTKNRLSWMELAAAPPRSAHIRVGALGGRGERRALCRSCQRVCWMASGFWLLYDPSGESVQSSTAAKNAGDPRTGPEKLLEAPCKCTGGVGRPSWKVLAPVLEGPKKILDSPWSIQRISPGDKP